MAFPFFMVTYHHRVCKKFFGGGWYGYQGRQYIAGNGCHTGAVDEEAAAVLGHTDLRTTQIYCYISLANVKSAYRKYAA